MSVTPCLLLLACLAPLVAAEGETRTETFDWGTVTIPVEAAPGDTIGVSVTFEPALAADGVLAVHLPWWAGNTRMDIMAHAKVAVTTGATGPVVLQLPIKQKDGMTKLAATVFVAPDGRYRNRVLGSEVGPILVR